MTLYTLHSFNNGAVAPKWWFLISTIIYLEISYESPIIEYSPWKLSLI